MPASAWERWGAYALLLFVVVVWGGSFVAARLVLYSQTPDAPVLTPTMLATVRFTLASAIFLPILLRQHAQVKPLRRADVPVFLLLGQLGISVYFWLQYTGLQLTNAGLAAVLVVGLIPLATMLTSGLALGEPLGGRRALALVLGAAGVVIVVSQQELALALASGFLFGAACLIANAFCFAIYSTLIRGIRARYSSLTATAGMTVAGTLGLLLFSLVSEDWSSLATITGAQWLAIAYLAVVCSAMAYFFYNYALTRIEASKAAVWLYLEPPVAMILGALLLSEAIAIQTVIGGIVILASLYLTQRS
jgi:drug/metabolite transporter (DMT)-like permease